MPVSPNENFKLNIEDVDLIEAALHRHMNYLQLHGNPERAMYIYQLLGRIHNQKNWYRPEKNYVSG